MDTLETFKKIRQERLYLAAETLLNMIVKNNCIEDAVKTVEKFRFSNEIDLSFSQKCDDVRKLIQEIKTQELYK